MPTFSGQVVHEVHNAHSEVHSIESEGTATVTLQCAWSIRHAVVQDILANRRLWPYSVGIDGPRATNATVSPLPSSGSPTLDGQGIIYTDALIEVEYSTMAEADLVSESLEPSMDMIALDFKKFRWDEPEGDPLEEDEAPAFQLFRGQLVRKFFKVAPPLPTSLLTLQGKTNEADYTSSALGITFPIETLLYMPPVMERTITTAGVQGWDITIKFQINWTGWNKFWRADEQTWSEMYVRGKNATAPATDDPYKNYPTGDFTDWLF